MDTPFQTAIRLLDALDEMLNQETALIRTMDFVEAVQVRERSGPLVERLCFLADDPTVRQMAPCVQLLLEKWGQNHHFLDEQLHRMQIELNRVSEVRNRLRKVLSAYCRFLLAEFWLNTAA
jgi:hypothetical protein